jgi:hypothetical protein
MTQKYKEGDPLPPGCTLLALPFVSKQGFTGATVMSLVNAIVGGGLGNCKFLFMGDHTQVGARNAAARDAIKSGAEYLFFVDSDMDFPVETLRRLKDASADIACTQMWSRNIPSFMTVMRYGQDSPEGLRQMEPYYGTGIEEVDACGMACTLIRTDLLKKMDDPYFVSGVHGEDASFCFVAKQKHGAVIKCDYGLTAGHWGVMRMAGQDFTRDAANQPMSVSDPEMLKRMGAKL